MRSSSTTRSRRCDLTGCMISCIILFPGVRTPKRAVQGEYPTDHQALTAISSTLQLAAMAAIGGHHDAARAQTRTSTSKCDDARKGRQAMRAGQRHVCQFRDSESLAAALPVLDHVLGAPPGRRGPGGLGRPWRAGGDGAFWPGLGSTTGDSQFAVTFFIRL